jgi:hypothetical protein
MGGNFAGLWALKHAADPSRCGRGWIGCGRLLSFVQGNEAWNLGSALQQILKQQPDTVNATAATAVAQRLAKVQINAHYGRWGGGGRGGRCLTPDSLGGQICSAYKEDRKRE